MQRRYSLRADAHSAPTALSVLINVRAIPNSRRESVKQTGQPSYTVKVRERALEGRANAAGIASLARHFGVSELEAAILRGAGLREKTVEIGMNM